MRSDHIWIFALEWEDAKASVLVHARTKAKAHEEAQKIIAEKIKHTKAPTVFRLVGTLPELIEKGNGGFLAVICTVKK